MRLLMVIPMLSIAACSVNSHYSDPRRVSRAKTQFEVRDACLAKNTVPYANGDSDASNIARAVSLSCKTETDKLIEISNPTGDPDVTAAIRKDAEFRATGYVLKARGQGSTN